MWNKNRATNRSGRRSVAVRADSHSPAVLGDAVELVVAFLRVNLCPGNLKAAL